MIERGSRVPSAMPSRVRQAAGGDVAHHHLQRDDLHLADQLLAHVQAADEMGGDADLGQPQHQVFADAVVEHALAGDHALLGAVEGGGVVLEVLHQGARLRPLEQDLGLAFVELAAAGHHCSPWRSPRRAGDAMRRRARSWRLGYSSACRPAPPCGVRVMQTDRLNGASCGGAGSEQPDRAALPRQSPAARNRPCRTRRAARR